MDVDHFNQAINFTLWYTGTVVSDIMILLFVVLIIKSAFHLVILKI